MKWELKEPLFGDVVRVKVGSIYHYGIFVNDDEVIQFGLSPRLRNTLSDEEVEVCASNVEQFLLDGFLEVGVWEKRDAKCFPPQKRVALAQKRIGEKGYNILYNNCEHFANECYFGKSYSSQTDDVRKMFKSLPVADVYIAKMPEYSDFSPLYPPLRQREVASVKNENVKREKYFVWKLLEYALMHTFGKNIKDIKFRRDKSGKWTCKFCEFSLSHSHSALCVAISRTPIGVDVELVQPPKADLSKRILTADEQRAFACLGESEQNEFLITAWARKEALFKQKKVKGLTIEGFVNQDGATFERLVFVGEQKYALAVATEHPERVKLYENATLK